MVRLRVSHFVLFVAAISVLAAARPADTGQRRFPDLRGMWEGEYQARNGAMGTLAVNITTQRRGNFSGTLQDDPDGPNPGPVLNLTGTITRAGRDNSVARRRGYRSTKTGRLSSDGNTVSGTYRDQPGGRGTFTFSRVP